MHYDRLILLAHGSADPLWQRPFVELTAAVGARLGADRVRLAFMELCSPTLLGVAEQALGDRQLSLLVLPVFLAAGAHLSRDIPAQVNAATARFPQLRIKLLPAIGEDPRVRSVFQQIACEQFNGCDTVRG